MSHEVFLKALVPKVTGSWNLHTLLPFLDFFIVLSSLSGIVGIPGQANYAGGNTYQDSLVRYRLRQSQRAFTIDLGMIVDVGSLTTDAGKGIINKLKRWDFAEMYESELLAVLDYCCDTRRPLPSPQDAQLILGFDDLSTLPPTERNALFWGKRRLFSHLNQARFSDERLPKGVMMGGKQSSSSPSLADLKALISLSSSRKEIAQLIAEALRTKLAATLDIPEGTIDVTTSMVTLGIDSIVAVELTTWMRLNAGAEMSGLEMLSAKSLIDIGMQAAEKSEFVQVGVE